MVSHNPPFRLEDYRPGTAERYEEAFGALPRGMPADWWPERVFVQMEDDVDGELLVVRTAQTGGETWLPDVRKAYMWMSVENIRLAMWQALEDRRLHPEKYAPIVSHGHRLDVRTERCQRCGSTRKEREDNLAPKECTGNDDWRDELLSNALVERNQALDELATLKRAFRVMVDAQMFASQPPMRAAPGRLTGLDAYKKIGEQIFAEKMTKRIADTVNDTKKREDTARALGRAVTRTWDR